MFKTHNVVKNFLVTLLVFIVGGGQSIVSAQIREYQANEIMGQLTMFGAVVIDGVPAMPSSIITGNHRIKTSENSMALINFGKLGSVRLGSNTDLELQVAADLFGGALIAGRTVIHAAQGVHIVVTSNESVVTADGQQESTLTVNSDCQTTRVAAVGNDVKIVSPQKVELVVAEGITSVDNIQGPKCEPIALPNKGWQRWGKWALLIGAVGGVAAGVVIAATRDQSSPSVTNPVPSPNPVTLPSLPRGPIDKNN